MRLEILASFNVQIALCLNCVQTVHCSRPTGSVCRDFALAAAAPRTSFEPLWTSANRQELKLAQDKLSSQTAMEHQGTVSEYVFLRYG